MQYCLVIRLRWCFFVENQVGPPQFSSCLVVLLPPPPEKLDTHISIDRIHILVPRASYPRAQPPPVKSTRRLWGRECRLQRSISSVQCNENLIYSCNHQAPRPAFRGTDIKTMARGLMKGGKNTTVPQYPARHFQRKQDTWKRDRSEILSFGGLPRRSHPIYLYPWEIAASWGRC